MGLDKPKQFYLLNNEPILLHTLNCFHQFDKDLELLVVMHPAWIDFWKDTYQPKAPKHKLVAGGKARFHSVKNGLMEVKSLGIIGVHDAVRPFPSKETLQRVFHAAEENGSAIPTLPLNDSIRKLELQDSVAVERKDFVLVQTPQCFRKEILLHAYQQEFSESFTDDASVCESAGYKIALVDGNRENIKITTPFDLVLAKTLIGC